jgi:hypothetical protein
MIGRRVAVRCGAGRAALLLFAVALWPMRAGAEAAASPASTAARKQASEMYLAFARGDMETFIDHMAPKVVEAMGGRQRAIETSKQSLAAAAAQGLTPTSATVAPVQQLVEIGPSKLQVIIPVTVIMTSPNAQVRQQSFVFGISSDSGKTWKFVDTGSSGGDGLRKIFPECSPALKVPPRGKPEIIPKK